MRERTFRVPTARELLKLQGLKVPEKITERYILGMIADGAFEFAGQNYPEAVGKIEDLNGTKNTMVLFPPSFHVPLNEANQGVKSLSWMLKIDSQENLRKSSESEVVPARLTREFLQEFNVAPKDLLRAAIESSDPYNPQVGFYWMRSRGQANAFTPLGAVTAYEMKQMSEQGAFPKAVAEDPHFYGTNITFKVASRTEQGKEHLVPLIRMPIQYSQSRKDFSSWINIANHSTNPYARHSGEEHNKLAESTIIWSAPEIYAFLEGARVLRETEGNRRIYRANPFGIPTEEMVDFTDDARLRCLMLKRTGDGFGLDVLYKLQINRLLMSRTAIKGYDSCWAHHGQKGQLDYLFKPDSPSRN